MSPARIYLYIEDFGNFFCNREVTQATRPVIVARINQKKIIAVRVLDFGQKTETAYAPDVHIYRQASLEKIKFENMPKSFDDAKRILGEMGEKSIFFAYKSF